MDNTNQINTTTVPGIGQSVIVPYPPTQFSPQSAPRSTGKLAEALAKAQAEFKTVNKSKTAKGEKFNYKYADLNDVLGMAVPVLAKHGIAFSQPIRREGDRTFVVTRLQLGDEILEDAGLPIPTQVRPQELGTYLSYYRRYSVSSFLGIAADEDTDAVETRPDYKPSSSGQTQAKPAVPEQATPAKRGRPANPPKATTVAPTEPVKSAAPPIANDDDIPSNIGAKATPEERKEFQTRLKAYIAETDVDRIKAFVAKKTNSETTTNLSKRDWESILGDLDAAKTAGTLASLLAPSPATSKETK